MRSTTLTACCFIFRMSPLKRNLNLRKIRKMQATMEARTLVPARAGDSERFGQKRLRSNESFSAEPRSLPCPRFRRCSRPATNCPCSFAARPPRGPRPQLAPPSRQTSRAGRGPPVTQPEKIRSNAEFRAQLEAIAPDAIVVVAYGRIIPPWMLALPRLGLHQSAWVAAAKISRRRAHSVGRGHGRRVYRQHHHAA